MNLYRFIFRSIQEHNMRMKIRQKLKTIASNQNLLVLLKAEEGIESS